MDNIITTTVVLVCCEFVFDNRFIPEPTLIIPRNSPFDDCFVRLLSYSVVVPQFVVKGVLENHDFTKDENQKITIVIDSNDHQAEKLAIDAANSMDFAYNPCLVIDIQNEMKKQGKYLVLFVSKDDTSHNVTRYTFN